MLLPLASITAPLVKLATNVIASLGLAGVALMTLSAGVIGIPGTEAPMLFSGFDVARGHFSLAGIILAGVLGDMLGATIAYSIGYFGQRELIERQGSKLHVSADQVDRAHVWFERYGAPVMFLSRLIPLVRAVFPYAAGVARMPFGRVFLFTLSGSIIWIGGLALLGRAVGHSWSSLSRHLEYVDYAAVALLVALVAYFLVRRHRSARARRAAIDAVSE